MEINRQIKLAIKSQVHVVIVSSTFCFFANSKLGFKYITPCFYFRGKHFQIATNPQPPSLKKLRDS